MSLNNSNTRVFDSITINMAYIQRLFFNWHKNEKGFFAFKQGSTEKISPSEYFWAKVNDNIKVGLNEKMNGSYDDELEELFLDAIHEMVYKYVKDGYLVVMKYDEDLQDHIVYRYDDIINYSP